MKNNKFSLFLGYLVYAIIFASFSIFPGMAQLLGIGLQLATEITILIFIALFYPVVVVTYKAFRGAFKKSDGRFVDVQAKLAASVSISLGLLGTFKGLIEMVSRIADSLKGTGDISERIETLLLTIGSALNAMSYAFITSILGVISSVVILLAYNFWKYSFSQEDIDDEATSQTKEQEILTLANVEQQLNQLKQVNLSLVNKIAAVGTDKSTLDELISRVDALVARQVETANQTISLVTHTKQTNETIVGAFSKLNELVAGQSNIAPEFAKLSQHLVELGKDVRNQVESSNNSANLLVNKFEGLAVELSNLSAIESHLLQIRESGEAHKQQLNHALDNLNANIVGSFHSINDGLSSLPAIENSVQTIANQNSNYSQQISAVEKALAELSKTTAQSDQLQKEIVAINRDILGAVNNETTAINGFAQQQIAINSQTQAEQQAYKAKVKSALEALI